MPQMVAAKGKDSADDQKMITVYVDKELARAFKSRVDAADLDVSKVVRRLIADYMEKGEATRKKLATEIRREELERYIIDSLSDYAASHTDDKALVDWMGGGFGLRPGTLQALLE